MQLRSLALLVAAALVGSASAATTTPKYYCETDADCETNFPGTVCISVDAYGETTKKCTPNTKERPACRGAQPGLCPSYQSPEIGSLNVHCVFVAKDASQADTTTTTSSSSSKAGSSSGSGSATKRYRSRWLSLEATNKTASSGDGSAAGTVKAPTTDSSTSGTPAAAEVVGSYAKVKIGKVMVTGQFKCVDISDCENQAYDPSTCNPTACGPANVKMQCNYHGTCTYPSIQTMNKRTCMCYAGFGGDKCQQELSNECDVDCGYGGDCVSGVCKCKKGYDGASYKGKKGKPNQRCTKCTNDLACQNSNTCDIETGACVCAPGFSGPTCGATEDSCTTKNCGKGNCQVFANGTSACYCPICAPDCQICKEKDCSSCPSPASTIAMSKVAVFVAAVALVVGNLHL